jgi:hypothetical protein
MHSGWRVSRQYLDTRKTWKGNDPQKLDRRIREF